MKVPDQCWNTGRAEIPSINERNRVERGRMAWSAATESCRQYTRASRSCCTWSSLLRPFGLIAVAGLAWQNLGCGTGRASRRVDMLK
jgi:hypothetical protein